MIKLLLPLLILVGCSSSNKPTNTNNVLEDSIVDVPIAPLILPMVEVNIQPDQIVTNSEMPSKAFVTPPDPMPVPPEVNTPVEVNLPGDLSTELITASNQYWDCDLSQANYTTGLIIEFDEGGTGDGLQITEEQIQFNFHWELIENELVINAGRLTMFWYDININNNTLTANNILDQDVVCIKEN